MWPFKSNTQSNHQQVTAVAPVPQPAAVSTNPAASRAVPVVMERPAPQSIDVKAENIKSIIAQGEFFEGNLRFQRGIKVDGHVKGNIEFGLTDGMLVVNDKGLVEGDIFGPRAIIVGEVVGNIMISGRLIVLPSARIHGDIAAGTLQLHEGSSLDGRICTINDMQQRTHEHEATQQPVAPAPAPEAPAEVLRFAIGAGQGR